MGSNGTRAGKIDLGPANADGPRMCDHTASDEGQCIISNLCFLCGREMPAEASDWQLTRMYLPCGLLPVSGKVAVQVGAPNPPSTLDGQHLVGTP